MSEQLQSSFVVKTPTETERSRVGCDSEPEDLTPLVVAPAETPPAVKAPAIAAPAVAAPTEVGLGELNFDSDSIEAGIAALAKGAAAVLTTPSQAESFEADARQTEARFEGTPPGPTRGARTNAESGPWQRPNSRTQTQAPIEPESLLLNPTVGQLIEELLRDRPRLIARIREGRHLPKITKTMLVTAMFGIGLFGATLGSYRGGLQIMLAGIKLPLAGLLTASIAAPSLTGMRRALSGRGSVAKDFALVLSALALVGLLLSALAPILWAAVLFNLGYHDLILLLVTLCGAAGAAALWFFARASGRQLKSTMDRSVLLVGVLTVFLLVGAQMAWSLRPFLVRPAEDSVVVLRSVEGNFLDSVITSVNSAQGIYRSIENKR